MVNDKPAKINSQSSVVKLIANQIEKAIGRCSEPAILIAAFDVNVETGDLPRTEGEIARRHVAERRASALFAARIGSIGADAI